MIIHYSYPLLYLKNPTIGLYSFVLEKSSVSLMTAGGGGDPTGGAGFWEENKSKPLLSFCVGYSPAKWLFYSGLRFSILLISSAGGCIIILSHRLELILWQRKQTNPTRKRSSNYWKEEKLSISTSPKNQQRYARQKQSLRSSTMT